ncbi:MAG: DUF975 family protein [Syntrophomonadaceae bacterium]|nr:DUF975 family protein [Syntrophomonadaceae bacterium]
MINRAELKLAAKEQIKGHIGILLLCYIILTIIVGFSSILSFLTAPPLYLGLTIIFLNITRGYAPEIKDLFQGFYLFGKVVWLNILLMVFIFLWSLLFFIPGLIKAHSYAMSFFILAENPEFTAREALNRSKEMMNGHKWELFVLCLSFILWFLLCGITLGLASIYVGPYFTATVTNFYYAVKTESEGQAA